MKMENLKVDLKKVYKEEFKIKVGEFKKIDCSKGYYIALDGIGDPNSNEEYLNKVVALYKIAYGVKMDYKKSGKDFVVMPLSGLWWSDDYKNFIDDKKEVWKWTMMIRLPEFVLERDIEIKKESFKKEKIYKYIKDIRYMEYEEGEAFQTLYVGPYKNEGETVKKLHEIILKNGYTLDKKHHEIYLSDPRKTPEEKLKTIIRQSIK